MLFGYHDFIFIFILILINIKYLYNIQNKNKKDLIFILLFPSFGILFPFISQAIEINNICPCMDNTEILYTLIKFPIYWVMGIIQIIIFKINNINFK